MDKITTISGHTMPFAVLGHPIGHTLSPVMHNAAFAALEMDAIYLAFDVAPAALPAVLPAMAAMGFRGVNLTVPLKEVAFRELADLDESARRMGAVNTLQFLPERIRGFNTDGYGFLCAVREAFAMDIAGRCLFLFGCGGAGRAVALTSAAQGADRIFLADMDTARVSRLAAEVRAISSSTVLVPCEVGSRELIRFCREAELVVQATPVGMKPGEVSPLPAEAFSRDQKAFDLIYNLPETPFMRAAVSKGAVAVNGLGMLLHQGAEAFRLWTNRAAPLDVMRAALETALYRPH